MVLALKILKQENKFYMNNTNHRFVLLKKSKKYTCPYCNSPKSFRRYVDTFTGQELANECGICDHENRCPQRNYPPREYFKDHPELRKDWLKEHEPDRNWARGRGKGTLTTVQALAEGKGTIPAASALAEMQDTEKKVSYLPDELPQKYLNMKSVLKDWLGEVAMRHGIDRTVYEGVCLDYKLGGGGKMGAVVFWQIDREGRVRTGKVMEYLPNGHRTGNPDWIHSSMVGNGVLPSDWELSQCLYGEHLLTQYPDKPVGLVESEKTALICAMFFPRYVWLASGGCGQLSVEKMEPLIGREVLVIPDSGEFYKWKLIMLRTRGIRADVVSELEALPGNTDLADILLGEVEGKLPRKLLR